MFVAIPTAMPETPLIKRFGSTDGSITGSFREPSKLSTQLTVFFSRSLRIYLVIFAILDSVYRIAAAESPSIEPKLP